MAHSVPRAQLVAAVVQLDVGNGPESRVQLQDLGVGQVVVGGPHVQADDRDL